ncbi:hypothetical protein HPB49_009868 [Dermacentor silvarum]|uniref:Uncharacterized protein n=1 Tax=Dermacentor silvarum TaxID=543639 RepID=A0ACB8DZ65_DERSI|nr:hypothetical protein HPB49_009868 [Dermacentor silvarum]
MDAKNTYTCSRCHQRTHSLAALFRHLCASHGTESGWNCSYEGCVRTYRLYSSFRKHVSRHHKHLFPSSSSEKSVDLLLPDNTHNAVDEPTEETSDETGDEPIEEPSDHGVLNAGPLPVAAMSTSVMASSVAFAFSGEPSRVPSDPDYVPSIFTYRPARSGVLPRQQRASRRQGAAKAVPNSAESVPLHAAICEDDPVPGEPEDSSLEAGDSEAAEALIDIPVVCQANALQKDLEQTRTALAESQKLAHYWKGAL